MSDLEDILPGPRGLNEPRYRANPIYLFFEDFILAVIGELPEHEFRKIQDMNLQRVFHTEAVRWPEVIAEALHLSNTIEVSVLDLWTRNRATLLSQGKRYHPLAFAQDFADNYMAEGSQVDVWTPEALAEATVRLRVPLEAARRLTRRCS